MSKLLEEIKKSSSAWIKNQRKDCGAFGWQAGYGAFSLGQSQLDVLIRYIDGQHEHHQNETFQDEYLELLHRYHVEYDEKYLWG